jgi:hypothetical protein
MSDTKQSISINPNAKAVLPDGKILGRGEILAKLGLDPQTTPDAWLAIAGCGSNAAALHLADAQQLVNQGIIQANHPDVGQLRTALKAKG